MQPIRFIILLLLGLAAASVPPVPPSGQTARPRAFEVAIRCEPLVNLLFQALAAADDPAIAAPEHLAGAVEAVRAMRKAGIEDPGFLAGIVSECEAASEVAAAFARLPAERPAVSGGGEPIPFRDLALDLARGLEAAEDQFLAVDWQARKAALEGASASLRNALDSSSGSNDWRSHAMSSLCMTSPQETVPVYLVTVAPDPGAVTYRTRAGGACFIGTADAVGSTLTEIVVHEVIHALDVSTAEEPTALSLLRDALAGRGIERGEPEFRDYPHLVVFIQAAESVRRTIDSAHRDYGETAGVYERLQPAAGAVRSAWLDYLEARATLEEAVERIAAAAEAQAVARRERKSVSSPP
jgi:hypothetical protein